MRSFLSRRRRDLNPRAAINDLHPFQGCPFGQLGYFSKMLEYSNDMMLSVEQHIYTSRAWRKKQAFLLSCLLPCAEKALAARVFFCYHIARA